MIKDTYQCFDAKTKAEVEAAIVEIGCFDGDPLELKQNESPTVGEMLALAEKYPQITYSGHIIAKPRDDYRVSLDGFTVTGLSGEDALRLSIEYSGADDLTSVKGVDGFYSIEIWWD